MTSFIYKNCTVGEVTGMASSFDRIPNAPWMRFNVATCDDPRIVRWLERQLGKAPNGNLGLSQ
jgi:hypothetical protein